MPYAKQLTQNGIIATSDGVLKDFISRKNYRGALVTGVIPAAIEKRETEILFLRNLEHDLIEEVGDTNG